MNKEENEIRGGIIFLGSLFWEDEHNAIPKKRSRDLGKARRKWREKYLLTDKTSVQQIPLPIGYGRRSESREKTFTMVLSRRYWDNQGKGLVVPFKTEINFSNLNSFKAQVRQLAKSEGIYDANNKKFVADWGSAVAIYINPNSSIEKQKKTKEKWSKIISPDNGYDKNIDDFTWLQGDSLLNSGYVLSSDLDIKTEFDFLLFTYMQPNYENPLHQKDYPTPKTIGEAIEKSGYSTYFCQNRVSGIVTADDDEISKHIPKSY